MADSKKELLAETLGHLDARELSAIRRLVREYDWKVKCETDGTLVLSLPIYFDPPTRKAEGREAKIREICDLDG